LLLEPEPRGTAAALVAAALVARRVDPGAVVVSLPADHVVEEGEAFAASIARACGAAERGWLTILGVKPRHASSALGYIEPGAAVDGLQKVHRVARFIEKPDLTVAESLIAGGALWNAGIVVARADTVIEAMQRHEPTVLEAVERSLQVGGSEFDDVCPIANEFAAAPSISFDKAVLERHGNVAVTELDAAWRDVGTWVEVAELYPADGEGNRNTGWVQLSASRDTFVFSSHRLVVGMGLKDLVVVDTSDALLIAERRELGQLREAVEALAAGDLDTGSRSGPRSFDKSNKTGIVVIGRNEGERLIACLRSLELEKYPVVYVDSGSSDDSLLQREAVAPRPSLH
jgi:mannose-1-phosphate guanylyltransferase/mannose-6-phosphate isomerase